MRLTIIHPCIGRRAGDKSYVRTWQMEPLPAASIGGLTPPDVEVRFYDDRMERIPFDEPADLVAISVETYTAKRSYQIASEYRRRKTPVVMGGFHASLVPDEVRHAGHPAQAPRGHSKTPKIAGQHGYAGRAATPMRHSANRSYSGSIES